MSKKLSKQKHETSKKIISITQDIMRKTGEKYFLIIDVKKEAQKIGIPNSSVTWQVHKLTNMGVFSTNKKGSGKYMCYENPLEKLESTTLISPKKEKKIQKKSKKRVVGKGKTFETMKDIISNLSSLGTFSKEDLDKVAIKEGISSHASSWQLRNNFLKEGLVEKVPYPKNYEGNRIKQLYKMTTKNSKDSDPKKEKTEKSDIFKPVDISRITFAEMGKCINERLNELTNLVNILTVENEELKETSSYKSKYEKAQNLLNEANEKVRKLTLENKDMLKELDKKAETVLSTRNNNSVPLSAFNFRHK